MLTPAEFPVTVTRRRAWFRSTVHLVVVAALVCLAAANVAVRASWQEMEDGVLWDETTGALTAKEIAEGSPAAEKGLRRGDVLAAINGREVTDVQDVLDALHNAGKGEALTYTILRLDSSTMVHVPLDRVPAGSRSQYFVLAAVGIFSLLVGAGVRLRRPDNQATLHFFWLTVAFFGVLSLSFTARLDPLDWVFYWGDVIAMLFLPPVFLHFALMFPERPDSWARSDAGRAMLPLLYLPALLLGAARVAVIL
ncbi:MAG: PDZ domain-containing protein, partial [Acidobacteria bacterium]|nr:PDZ domain-containing protein [Acidobacteriota bacterium]